MQTAALTMQVTRTGIHFLAFTEHKGELRKAWRGQVQTWDMKQIPREDDHFRVATKKYGQLMDVLQTREGKEAVNNLKNKKLNDIVNKHLEEELKKYEQYFEQNKNMNPEKHIALHLTKEMIAEPLVGNNNMSHERLHISKEDIYNEFVKLGLL